jgi:hypothetical protein
MLAALRQTTECHVLSGVFSIPFCAMTSAPTRHEHCEIVSSIQAEGSASGPERAGPSQPLSRKADRPSLIHGARGRWDGWPRHEET